MKTAFIVTSAIETGAGIYTPDIRCLQTLETVNSIRQNFPDALLILAEGGKHDVFVKDEPMWQKLRSQFNIVLDLTENDQIAHLHQTILDKLQTRTEMGGMTGIVKSVAEITLMKNILEAIRNHEQLAAIKDVDRIFKISGRYVLSPLFDASVYDDAAGKYVFRKRDPSWIPDAQNLIGTDHFFASRLWSFDTALLDEVILKFDAMFEDAMKITETTYIDVEHLLYKHIGTDNVVELKNTHLMGTIAPNGLCIYD